MNYQLPRCEVLPLADHQTSLRIDGRERLRWHYGADYPRPFFYPLVGPSGAPLTRMGHPGAPNHDHHRSIWFAHDKVLGINFWGEGHASFIRQKEWLCYEDGEEQAAMAVKLAWHDGHDPAELLEQELIAIVRPAGPQETLLEIQTTFRPRSEMLEFGQSNFGFFAVRVAKGISAHFGGGELTNSEGQRGEPAIFGKPARWMDYSGPVPMVSQDGLSEQPREATVEGITYFDHPENPGFPSHWHVREDGWMCASVCMQTPRLTTRAEPLKLRYMLHAHAGDVDSVRAEQLESEFHRRPGYQIVKATAKHQQFELRSIRPKSPSVNKLPD